MFIFLKEVKEYKFIDSISVKQEVHYFGSGLSTYTDQTVFVKFKDRVNGLFILTVKLSQILHLRQEDNSKPILINSWPEKSKVIKATVQNDGAD